MLTKELQQQLLAVARASILHGLNTNQPLIPAGNGLPPALIKKRAAFVTLKINAALRGCVGTTEARESLIVNVADYAYRAAFHDPRFEPLQKDEFDQIKLHISILSENEPIEFSSEPDLIKQLQPGIDGLIIKKGACRATFLPSVWDSIPDPKVFLQQLKKKAYIPANEAPEQAWRYYADNIEEG